jgi:RNA polymerase sigma-70 factor (ECF subfamily)
MNDTYMEKMTSQLVKEAERGNQIAWNTLVKIFQKRIFAVALVITKDVHDADDATQETFVTFFKNLKKIRDPEKTEQWLLKTAINKARDLYRRNKIRRWLPLSDVKAKDPSNVEESYYLTELKQIFETWQKSNLSNKEQLVFQLRFGEEKELGEIAGVLGMNINTVKTHLHRAMKKLRSDAKELIKGKSDE